MFFEIPIEIGLASGCLANFTCGCITTVDVLTCSWERCKYNHEGTFITFITPYLTKVYNYVPIGACHPPPPPPQEGRPGKGGGGGGGRGERFLLIKTIFVKRGFFLGKKKNVQDTKHLLYCICRGSDCSAAAHHQHKRNNS